MKKAFLLLGLLAGGLSASAQWISQPITFGQSGGANYAISAVDANVAWTTVVRLGTGPTRQLMRTINGGTTWASVSVSGLTTTEYVIGLHALDASTAWVVVESVVPQQGLGRVLKTTDGGQTWTRSTTTAQFSSPDSFLQYVRFFSPTQGVAIGDAVNGTFEIYTTTNAGVTWTAVPAANIPAAQASEQVADPEAVVLAQQGNTLWFCSTSGRVFRTTDAGQTWTVAPTPFTHSDYPIGLSFRDANNGLLMTDEGDLARTTNGGLTWTRISPTGPLHAIGLDAVPGTRTYVSTGITDAPTGTSAGSSYSTDDGQTWTAIESTIQHAFVDFVSPTVGWSGGLHLDASGEPDRGTGMNKYAGPTLATARPKTLALHIAPNPSADGRFRVQVPAGPAAQLRVRDALGRLVLEQPAAAAAETTLDLSRCRAGMYTLELRAGDALGQQKLVVQ